MRINLTNQKNKINSICRMLDRHDLTALGICLLALLTWVCLLAHKFYHFSYHDWDLALYSQTMWNLVHGSLTSSLLGTTFLANHSEYAAFFLVPLYALFQHPLTLVYLQVLSYVLGAFILYRIAKKNLAPPLAILIMLLYLVYPPNIFALLFEFHFDTLSIGFLFLLYLFFQESKLIPFLITMILVACLKENMPPIVAMFGILALFSREKNKWLWGVLPFVFGIGFFYLSVLVLTPAFRAEFSTQQNIYLSQFQHLGATPLSMIKTILLQPWKIIPAILDPGKIKFLMDLLAPVMLLPLLSPGVLFLAAPVFLQTLLSSAPSMHSIFFHYTAPLTPFIFLALVRSLTLLHNKIRPVLFFGILFPLVFISLLNLGIQKNAILSRLPHNDPQLNRVRWEMIREIPRQAGVIATFGQLSQISQRKSLYALYNIWLGVNYFTGRSFSLPLDVTFAFLDLNDPWLADRVLHDREAVKPRLQSFFFDHDWRVVDAADDVVLLKKGAGEGPKLIERLREPTPFIAEQTILIDETLSFRTEIARPNSFAHGEKLLPFIFFWKAEQDVPKDYLMVIRLKQNEKEIFSYLRRIGYTILPTGMWKKGDFVKENFWLLLPSLTPGEYRIELLFYKDGDLKPALLKGNREPSPAKGNTVPVGTIVVP